MSHVFVNISSDESSVLPIQATLAICHDACLTGVYQISSLCRRPLATTTVMTCAKECTLIRTSPLEHFHKTFLMESPRTALTFEDPCATFAKETHLLLSEISDQTGMDKTHRVVDCERLLV